jgi:hypothetical protein
MNPPHDHPTIEIEDDGRTLATAEMHPADGTGVLHSDLHAEPGQLPVGTRARLVDAVLDSPDASEAHHLRATMPLGDTEMLQRVQERCDDVEARAAGATKIVDARLDPKG